MQLRDKKTYIISYVETYTKYKERLGTKDDTPCGRHTTAMAEP